MEKKKVTPGSEDDGMLATFNPQDMPGNSNKPYFNEEEWVDVGHELKQYQTPGATPGGQE